MTINLSLLISNVQQDLNDVPDDYLDVVNIHQNLSQSKTFIEKVVSSEVIASDEDYVKVCIYALATYYAYLNYTVLAEVKMGTLSPSVTVRLRELKAKAVMFINRVSEFTVTKELTVDTVKGNYVPFATTKTTVLEDMSGS